MKSYKVIFLFVALSAVTFGCKPEKNDSTAKQVEVLSDEAKKMKHDLKDYSYAQKAAYVSTMKSQLDDLNKELDKLSVKVENSQEAFKAEAEPKLQALRDLSAQLNKQLDNVSEATDSTWESIKSSTQKSFDSLKDGFQQSRQWLSEKIAP